MTTYAGHFFFLGRHMSKEEDRLKHSKRIHQKESHMRHNQKIAALFLPENSEILRNPHRLLDKSPVSCGNKKCVLCMNPRKAFGEKTIQERKFPDTIEFMIEIGETDE